MRVVALDSSHQRILINCFFAYVHSWLYWENISILALKAKEAMMEAFIRRLPFSGLAIDHTFKFAKHLANWRNTPLWKAGLTLFTDLGFIRQFRLVPSTSHEHTGECLMM